MPVISRLLGIVVTMYWDNHLPAHFHAKYGEYEVIVHIATGVVEGRFPKRALRHVMEWYDLRRDELQANWQRCRAREAPDPIAPLE